MLPFSAASIVTPLAARVDEQQGPIDNQGLQQRIEKLEDGMSSYLCWLPSRWSDRAHGWRARQPDRLSRGLGIVTKASARMLPAARVVAALPGIELVAI